MKRIFTIKVNGELIELPDPNEELSSKEVMEIYSNTYPQLLQGYVEEKGIRNETEMVYEFLTISGTKG